MTAGLYGRAALHVLHVAATSLLCGTNTDVCYLLSAVTVTERTESDTNTAGGAGSDSH